MNQLSKELAIQINNIHTIVLFIKVIEIALANNPLSYPEIGEDGVAALNKTLDILRDILKNEQ